MIKKAGECLVYTHVWENMMCGSGWFENDNVQLKGLFRKLNPRISCLNNYCLYS